MLIYYKDVSVASYHNENVKKTKKQQPRIDTSLLCIDEWSWREVGTDKLQSVFSCNMHQYECNYEAGGYNKLYTNDIDVVR